MSLTQYAVVECPGTEYEQIVGIHHNVQIAYSKCASLSHWSQMEELEVFYDVMKVLPDGTLTTEF